MRERGFTLLEVLIVVAVILVIAAIAVPNLLKSRMLANESSAVYSIRTINTAQVTYAVTYPVTGYATTLAQLGPPSGGSIGSQGAGLLDSVLGCAADPCSKAGYKFWITDVTGDPVSTYTVIGVPEQPGTSGTRGFCSNNMNPVMADPSGGTNCTVPLE
jgi:type IV pilus assembly protein PilA